MLPSEWGEVSEQPIRHVVAAAADGIERAAEIDPVPQDDRRRDQSEAARAMILGLVQRHEIDALLVTELSRWGRSTTDLLASLKELEARRVSLVALNGMTFDLVTPHARMMATLLAGIAEFERELMMERIRSDIAAAKARGARLGCHP